MIVSFFIPGEARGKGRPRATARGGFAKLYTDEKTASYENRVALAARDAMLGAAPLNEPLHMTVEVAVAPPASTSKRKRAAMLDGGVPPAKKPDLDNVIKAVMDGCNKIAFRDDCLVTKLSAEKLYSDTPGVRVWLAAAVSE